MGPLVVGGVGGSGTRVVAEILQKANIFIGTDLNSSLDNLWFTLLFKRPGWFGRASDADIHAALTVFEKAMVGTDPWSQRDCGILWEAATAMSAIGHDHLGRGRGEWPFIRMARMIDRSTASPRQVLGWGWKEPNAHVYLSHMAAHWKELRFVLVVRHGLDMAFSSNHAQLHNWGSTLGVPYVDGAPLPQLLLRYWLAANSQAIADGERLLGQRFVLVDYDALCAHPAEQVPWLIDRLAMPPDIPLDELIELPRRSPTSERYRDCDLSIFSAEELEGVRQLGYRV